LISFSKQEHKTEEFLKRNPRGKVPTIQDGETIIYESKAILHYLDDAYPENPLWPKDPKQRAQVETRIQEIDYLEKSYEDLRPFLFGQKKIEVTYFCPGHY
jgi:glutathione S-transferase